MRRGWVRTLLAMPRLPLVRPEPMEIGSKRTELETL